MIRTALVTGAAGGIGADVAHRLQLKGYQLLLVDFNQQALRELSDSLPGSRAIVCDLSDRQALAGLLEEIKNELPPIELAFINAGMIHVGDVMELSDEQIDQQLDVNLRSAMLMIKACAHNMAGAKTGHIIATVSMGGIIALKGSATYAATKFGLRGFMTSIKDELSPLGIKVSGIYPSGVDTPLLRYEARNQGSPLNFINRPQRVEDVGEAFERAVSGGKLEYYVPYYDSLSSRFVACFPWMISFLYPTLEKLGERGRKKYLERIAEAE